MILTTFFSLVVLAALVQGLEPTVDVSYSRYQGTQLLNGITQWLGIRYAAPPLGELRFQAPEPPVYQYALQVADTHGPICLSTPFLGPSNGESEDCLFLDVYAPTATKTKELLPVYIFIQGGGFNANHNANFNGSGLITASNHSIVVVNFNYRVGLFGFLASEEVLKSGDVNVGLKDQRTVLTWVQKYISRFGGDPGRVTIGGDSAGAASVSLHLTAYGGRDDGLFHAAAGESSSIGIELTVAESQYQYDALVARTGCNTTNDTLKCLRSMSTAALQSHNIKIPLLGNTTAAPLFMYGTVIDGDFVTDHNYNLYQQGKFVRVPTIWGDVTNGGTIFAPRSTNSVKQMNNFLKNQFPAITDTQLAQINAYYPRSAEQFPGTGAYWRALANAYGDMRYQCPGLFISSANANAGQHTWNYRYDVEDPTEAAQGLGVSHAVEFNAIWGPENVSNKPPASYSTSLNKGIVPIMQGYWVSFIKAHDPNTYRAAGTPSWEQYSAKEMNRIRIETNETVMETVDVGLKEHCDYLWSIAPSIKQ